jgi:hypothetical protein
MRRLLPILILATPAPALAEDDLGVEETRFEIVEKNSGKTIDVETDEPERAEETPRGPHNVDPFLGLEVTPQLGANLSMRLIRDKRSNSGEPGGNDGRIGLAGRADLSLWVLDLRVPFDASEDQNGPIELVAKVPFTVGDHHRFAPMLVAHVPTDRGLDESLFELAFGYRYARSGFGLELLVSGFSGTHERTKGPRSAGMIGWGATASYLIADLVGIVVEAEGTTAISERVERAKPAVGDTVFRLAPGVRFFPFEAGFSLGLAGVFTFVPDGYEGLSRDQGVLFDIGYTFL